MSAIREYAFYVHYHASNYVKQQKLPGNNAISNYVVNRINLFANQYQSKVSTKQKQDFADLISALMGRTTSSNYSPSDIKNLQDSIVDSLESGFVQGLDEVEWETGRVIGNRIRKGKTYKGATRYLTESQLQNLQSKALEIQKNIKKLENQIKLKGGSNPTLLSKLQKDLENYDNDLLNLLKQFEAGAKDVQLFGKILKSRLDVGTDMSSRIKRINEIAKQLGLLDTALFAAQGELFEKSIKAAGDMMAGAAVKAICDSFKSGGVAINNNQVVGKNHLNLMWLEEGIPAETWAKTKMAAESYAKTDGRKGYSISKNSSQQKTDVIITFPGETPIEGIDVNISAKSGNIFGTYGVKLVDGTDLWYLIQNLPVKDFLRPYLNIMAEHAYFTEFFTKDTEMHKKEASAIQKISVLRKDSILATKLIMVWKALSGNTFGRKFATAQLLVLNDTKGKQIYVIEIADILKVVCDKQNLKDGAISRFFDFDNFDFQNLYFENKYQDTIDTRMALLLNSIHRRKVSVTMRGEILNSIPNKVISK